MILIKQSPRTNHCNARAPQTSRNTPRHMSEWKSPFIQQKGGKEENDWQKSEESTSTLAPVQRQRIHFCFSQHTVPSGGKYCNYPQQTWLQLQLMEWIKCKGHWIKAISLER